MTYLNNLALIYSAPVLKSLQKLTLERHPEICIAEIAEYPKEAAEIF